MNKIINILKVLAFVSFIGAITVNILDGNYDTAFWALIAFSFFCLALAGEHLVDKMRGVIKSYDILFRDARGLNRILLEKLQKYEQNTPKENKEENETAIKD